MKTCIICGAPSRRKTCSPEHTAEHRRRRQKQYYSARQNYTYTLVEDTLPPERGGFNSGAMFSVDDVEAMLRNQSLTAGVVLARSDEKYIVRAKGRGLKLERMTQ